MKIDELLEACGGEIAYRYTRFNGHSVHALSDVVAGSEDEAMFNAVLAAYDQIQAKKYAALIEALKQSSDLLDEMDRIEWSGGNEFTGADYGHATKSIRAALAALEPPK